MRTLQRYVVCDEIASGGMASVHVGMLRAEGGFRRIVAIKVMHAQFAKDSDFRKMFLDEARIVSRVRDAHVVSTLDILDEGGELFLVMDYVHGPSLARVLADLAKKDETLPLRIAVTIVCDLVAGLHAAHEARSEKGEPLHVVHRDVSPHNVLVGADGISRVMDFGIATAADQLHLTRPGEVRGKASYMAPEHALGQPIDRRADVYAAGLVLFEALTSRRAFVGKTFAEIALKHMREPAPRASAFRSEVSPELDDVIARALSKDPSERFETARAMGEALEALSLRVSPGEVASWLAGEQGQFLSERDAVIASVNGGSGTSVAPEIQTALTVQERTAPRYARAFAILVAVAAVAGIVAVFSFRSKAKDTRDDAVQAVVTASATSPPVADSNAPAVATQMETHETEHAVATPKPIMRVAASVRAPATSRSATSETPATECCVGNIRVNVGRCRDNCPPGT